MKGFGFIGIAALLASPALALPYDPEAQSENLNELQKRDGHIDVTTWSGGSCGGDNQGTTMAGTTGKCVNMSNAGSFHVGGPSSVNPNGCAYVHAEFFHKTDCRKSKHEGFKYGPLSCAKPQGASAFMKCVG